MKRLFHLVGCVIIGLLAVQPALAAIVCGAPTAPCPMAITDMGPACAAAQLADLSGPRSAAQLCAMPRATTASVALPAARRGLALVVVNWPAQVRVRPALLAIAFRQAESRDESPPIYLRNRVFRI
ncbi:hypothetical protein DYQ86_09210 [Acidobacteria bacterium AB60]|nr:hypothetical protein DYQ86_09210 [Acidobacteria bacterium AB60]